MSDDLISRKAAIDAVDNFSMQIPETICVDRNKFVEVATGERYTMTKEEVKDLINALPSAEKTSEMTKELLVSALQVVKNYCSSLEKCDDEECMLYNFCLYEIIGQPKKWDLKED